MIAIIDYDAGNMKSVEKAFQYLNEELNATNLMDTHDAFSASYAHRVIFIKDG